MPKAYFVTATGTDVGKTYVLCGVLEQLRSRGEQVFAMKPVLSGYERSSQEDSDTGRILTALGRPVDDEGIAELTPWRFREPLSPDMAASREGAIVRLNDVAKFCKDTIARQSGIGFVEGAGGVMSPLGRDFSNLDLMTSLNLPVLLVAGAYLGTISHTLTACAALREKGHSPAAIVLCESSAGPVSIKDTAETISRYTRLPIHLVARGGSVPAELVAELSAKA